MKPALEAKELIDQKKFKEALVKLNEAVAVPNKTPYEQSVTEDLLAYCYAQLKDYGSLAKLYETQLADNRIPADQMADKIKFLTGTSHRQKNYAKAIQYGNRYLNDYGADDEIMDYLIRAHFAKGDYRPAADLALKQIKSVEAANNVPDIFLFDLLINCYFKLDDKVGMNSAVEDALLYYPSPDRWKSAIKTMRGENYLSDRELIEMYRLKKTLGILEPKEYIEMGELSMASANPGDARAVLEEGLAKDALPDPKDKEHASRLVGKAKTAAEADLNSMIVSEKEAAAKPKGDAWAYLGAAYLGHGRYDLAINAFKSGIAKGSLTTPDLANLQLGTAYLFSGKTAEAKAAFNAIPANSKLFRLAKLWSIYATGNK